MKSSKRIVYGQPSWSVASASVEAYVTETGGHLAPVTFGKGKKGIAPYSVAPWWEETLDPSLPAILKVLRGDFFCMPFGGNSTPYRGERHPVHGETANALWKLQCLERVGRRSCLHLSLKTKVRKGRVDKMIFLVNGEDAVYSRHILSGMSGPMSLGHHATLHFPDEPGSGVVSTSRFLHAQVCPEPLEDPAQGGYSTLKPGAEFDSLEKVPTAAGKIADLSVYPARRGFEDLVMLVADPDLPFAWTAVTFPKQRYVWFALKDPRVLCDTIFWISNGGRHYPPWNGRHVNVMGLEEVTSYFHFGLAESARENSWARKGYPTCLRLDPKRPLAVHYIMAVTAIPAGFDRVVDIEAGKGKTVRLRSASGKAATALVEADFLQSL